MFPNDKKQQSIKARLARAEGQLKAVMKLVEQGDDCEKCVQQLAAVRKALDKAFFEMISCAIESHVGGEAAADKEKLQEYIALLSKYA